MSIEVKLQGRVPMNTHEERNGVWRIAVAGVALLAVTAAISVVAYGTLNKDDATQEEGDGHGNHEAAFF